MTENAPEAIAERIERERQQLRARYGGLFDKVTAILYRHDPVGLNFGVNPDEYEPEAMTILPRLGEARSVGDVQRIIPEELVRWFDENWFGRPKAERLKRRNDAATEIWEAWRRRLEALRVAHIWAISDLARIFARHDDVIVSIHNPLRLDNRSEPRPDVVLLRADAPRDQHPSPEDARLVIEVAGRSVRLDRYVKGPLYAQAGIPEYWIVDLNGERIEVYREPSTDGYRSIHLYGRGERLSPAFAPDIVVEVDAIIGPPSSDEE